MSLVLLLLIIQGIETNKQQSIRGLNKMNAIGFDHLVDRTDAYPGYC